MVRILLVFSLIFTAVCGSYINHSGCVLSAEPPDPNSECCGIDTLSTFSIVGGEKTELEQYPWLVSIEYHNRWYNTYSIRCGGVLISGRYVLTAAHCLAGNIEVFGKPVNVYLGDYDIRNSGPDCIKTDYGEKCTDGALKTRIHSYIVHPGYHSNKSSNFNDIALIRLSTIAPYTNFIRPICLPSFDIISALPYEYFLYVAGWGAIKQNSPSGWGAYQKYEYDGIKRHVALPYKPIEFCRAALGAFVNQQHICAGGQQGKDSCTGDSGGPLMFEDDGTYVAIGIVSFGSGKVPCGTENYAAIYTNVFAHMNWIYKNIQQ
ncbi:phenoloxidase-activating enzyme-like [Hyposmocoma kahamanoa]|uniref:phenoloxidase-activating enzyme-like n=1 Tax=Hyposmocoma kahamanoa TaxID=1477025 RepID=UPI000E6D5B74|nr:phenoloxidase-activating enzyme-like [Hyposmocoma kahamanoa]